MRRNWIILAAAASALAIPATPSLSAQDAGANKAAKVQRMPKDADPDWEVMTARPGDPYARGDHIDLHGPHITLENETVEILLLVGYNVQKNQLVGLPPWAKTERWDVDGLANVDGEPNVAQLQTMVRKALAERFALKLHREQREMPVFALTVARGGPKLTANTRDPNGLPGQRNIENNGWRMSQYTNASMPELALMLLSSVDRPIVDHTGLGGRYDFQIKYTPDETRTTDPDAPPTLFTAIEEQIGLKLEPQKASADVLVLDSIERPGAN